MRGSSGRWPDMRPTVIPPAFVQFLIRFIKSNKIPCYFFIIFLRACFHCEHRFSCVVGGRCRRCLPLRCKDAFGPRRNLLLSVLRAVIVHFLPFLLCGGAARGYFAPAGATKGRCPLESCGLREGRRSCYLALRASLFWCAQKSVGGGTNRYVCITF